MKFLLPDMPIRIFGTFLALAPTIFWTALLVVDVVAVLFIIVYRVRMTVVKVRSSCCMCNILTCCLAR